MANAEHARGRERSRLPCSGPACRTLAGHAGPGRRGRAMLRPLRCARTVAEGCARHFIHRAHVHKVLRRAQKACGGTRSSSVSRRVPGGGPALVQRVELRHRRLRQRRRPALPHALRSQIQPLKHVYSFEAGNARRERRGSGQCGAGDASAGARSSPSAAPTAAAPAPAHTSRAGVSPAQRHSSADLAGQSLTAEHRASCATCWSTLLMPSLSVRFFAFAKSSGHGSFLRGRSCCP